MTGMRKDPYLFTPGPLTTSATTKEAMLHDWGSRDAEFIRINRRVRDRLVELAGGAGTHVCVPLQGSGTFIVEAMIGTLVPPSGKLLVLVNGAYGKRMVRMCEYYRRARAVIETPEDQAVRSGRSRRGPGGRSGDHARRGRALRDHIGRAEPRRDDRRGHGPPRPAPARSTP